MCFNEGVQWHVFLMCHCHLLAVVVRLVSEVEGKNKDVSIIVVSIDTYSLQW